MISYLYQWGKTPGLLVPLISLAIKGKIHINEVEGFFGWGREYKISLQSNAISEELALPPEEASVLNILRASLNKQADLHLDKNAKLIKKIFRKFEMSLEGKHEILDSYFPKQKWANFIVAFGILCSTFIYLFFSMLTFLVIMIIFIPSTWIFYYFLSAPNLEGRQIIDQIRNFRNYLSDEFRHQEDSSPEQFEYYLPYAVALGVQMKWVRGIQSLSYEPVWYSPKTARTLTAFALVTALSDDFARVLNTGDGSGGAGGGGGAGGNRLSG